MSTPQKLVGASGDPIEFVGELIGGATTQQDRHVGHSTPYISRASREKCGACRWFEVSIYKTEDPAGRYLVYSVGASDVPGERNFITIVWTNSAPEVLEALTIRKAGTEPYLPAPAARAISAAAGSDRDIKEAYFNRAVI